MSSPWSLNAKPWRELRRLECLNVSPDLRFDRGQARRAEAAPAHRRQRREREVATRGNQRAKAVALSRHLTWLS